MSLQVEGLLSLVGLGRAAGAGRWPCLPRHVAPALPLAIAVSSQSESTVRPHRGTLPHLPQGWVRCPGDGAGDAGAQPVAGRQAGWETWRVLASPIAANVFRCGRECPLPGCTEGYMQLAQRSTGSGPGMWGCRHGGSPDPGPHHLSPSSSVADSARSFPPYTWGDGGSESWS